MTTATTRSSHIIQIAGVLDRQDADVIVEAGPTHLGFPLCLEVNAEDITIAAAASIIKTLPPDIEPVLITYLNTATEVARLCKTLGLKVVQLHGSVSRPELEKLKRENKGLIVWKSLVVGKWLEHELIAQVKAFAPLVDAFITDTYSTSTGASGATGEIHDWQISRRLVEASPRPVILAGGLTGANVAEAVKQVRPAGVDAHTGVEAADGRKDPGLVNAFVQNARRSLAGLH